MSYIREHISTVPKEILFAVVIWMIALGEFSFILAEKHITFPWWIVWMPPLAYLQALILLWRLVLGF